MSLLDRGYTGHEHFSEVGLIHMNGRLYDPLMRRFLNADENIQDPYNTQNYNKYGYVMNNPLMYNDPSGEFIHFLVAVAIGALIGTASYAIGVYAATGSYHSVSLSGALKAAFWGAVSGAVTFGIGNCFSVVKEGVRVATEFAKTLGGYLVQGLAHGVAQGALTMMQNNGAGFGSAFASGFLGSLGAAGFAKTFGQEIAGSTVGTIAFGAVSGGVGASLRVETSGKVLLLGVQLLD
jgi:RHS repeat-associated protein